MVNHSLGGWGGGTVEEEGTKAIVFFCVYLGSVVGIADARQFWMR